MQEMQAPSLGREDPLEEEMTTHSSILAWKIPWTEGPGGTQQGPQKGLLKLAYWASSASLTFFPVLNCRFYLFLENLLKPDAWVVWGGGYFSTLSCRG